MLAAHNCASVDYMIKAGIVDALLESNIEFVVAGRMTSEQNSNYFQRGIISRPNPTSIDDAISDCFCGLAYLEFCAGMQNKLLDYIRNFIPVVSSRFCADGIGLKPDIHYLLASDSHDIVVQVLKIANDISTANMLANNAKVLLNEFYNQKFIERRFQQIISSY